MRFEFAFYPLTVLRFIHGFGRATRIFHKVQPEGAFRETQMPRGSHNSRQVHLKVRLENYKWRVDNDSSVFLE